MNIMKSLNLIKPQTEKNLMIFNDDEDYNQFSSNITENAIKNYNKNFNPYTNNIRKTEEVTLNQLRNVYRLAFLDEKNNEKDKEKNSKRKRRVKFISKLVSQKKEKTSVINHNPAHFFKNIAGQDQVEEATNKNGKKKVDLKFNYFIKF